MKCPKEANPYGQKVNQWLPRAEEMVSKRGVAVNGMEFLLELKMFKIDYGDDAVLLMY